MGHYRTLRDLISIDSRIIKSNLEIISYIKNKLKDFDSVLIPFEHEGNKMHNFLIKIEGKTNSFPLVFVGHVDTVDYSKNWEYDPFFPRIKDNRMYGLGSSDMKGGISSMISCAEKINKKPLRDIYFIFDGCEEGNSEGAREILKFISLKNAEIIIAEPTNRKIVLAQKGYFKLNLLKNKDNLLDYIPLEKSIEFNQDIDKEYNFILSHFKEDLTVLKKYWNPPFNTSKGIRLVKNILINSDEISIEKISKSGWTEAGLFKEWGEVINFGPGDYSVCHKPNESINLKDLDVFTQIYQKLCK